MSVQLNKVASISRYLAQRRGTASAANGNTVTADVAAVMHEIGNAPTQEAKEVLNMHGFCVLHRDQVSSLIGVLAVALESDDCCRETRGLLGELESVLTLEHARGYGLVGRDGVGGAGVPS